MVNSINLFKFEKFLGSRRSDTLAELRKIKFLGMQSISRKCLKPEQLPPTDEAAVQHVLPVYLKITYWKALSNTEIGPRL